MGQIYKFLNAPDVRYILEDETVVASSSLYFRREYARLEVKDPFINDPNEGRVVRVQTRPIRPVGRMAPADEAALKSIGVPVPPVRFGPGTVIVGNAAAQYYPPFQMICFCVGELESLKEVFSGAPRPENERPYDACLEVDDLDALMFDVLNKGLFRAKDGTEFPINRLFRTIMIANVTYGATTVGFDEQVVEPSPFRKDSSFAEQREVRAVFVPGPDIAGKVPPDRMIVRVPGLASHYRRIL